MTLIEPRLFRLAILGALLRRRLGTTVRAHAPTWPMAAPFLFGPISLGRLLLCSRRQRDRGLSREQQEGQRLLEVKAHDAVGVAQITDREVLPDVQIEITAARGEHEGARDGWRPDNLVLDEFFDMLQHGIPVVTGLSERRVSIGAEQY